MAAFVYRAVDAAGRQRSGIVEAPSAPGARQILRERGLLPIGVDPASEREDAKGATGRDAGRREGGAFSRRGLRPRVLALVTRQLATLVETGVRIEDALRTVAAQTRDRRAASVLYDVRAGVLEGRGFAEALGDWPASFPQAYRASVAAGEEASRLGAVLARLAGFVEERERNRAALRLALVYPCLLALVSLAVAIGLMTFVVPDIARIFVARGEELPFLTRALIVLSGWLADWGWALAAGLGLGALALGRALSRPATRRLLDRWLVASRLTADLARALASTQFAATLATLLQSGVALPQALDASGAVVRNLHFREAVATVARRVREGASLQRAVAEADVFPPLLVAMIVSGENAQSLGTALARAAADQGRELDQRLATFVALVEPMVLIVMGGFVLLLVLAIMMPIVSVNELAGGGL